MVATRSKGPTTPKAKTSKKTASESKPSGGIVRQLLASPFAEKNTDTDKAVTGVMYLFGLGFFMLALGLVVKQFQPVPEPEPSYIGKVSAMFGY